MSVFGKSELRMTEGSIPGKIIMFAIPLFLGNLFQQLYNTADTYIVSRLLGDEALAAVSSTGTLIFLLVGFFNGVFLGAGVVIARFYGSKDVKNMRAAIHTSLVLAMIFGIILTLIGTLLSPQLLVLMDTPKDVLPMSVSYVRTYFTGVIGMVMYNACMGIMQAIGDSRSPLFFLIISSVTNIALDYVLVKFTPLNVAGAALATIIAQFLSVILCMIKLVRLKNDARVSFRELRLDLPIAKMILRFGLPTGLQNSVISLANVVVQSKINFFGKAAMAGCGAFNKIEGFAFLPVTSFTAAISTFVSQNLGAKEYGRVKKGSRFGIAVSVLLAETIGTLIFVFARPIIDVFTSGEEALQYGIDKARICGLFFGLCALCHGLASVMRGAGKAVVPMVAMLSTWCLIRVAILEIFVPITKTIDIVNWVYPITWALCALIMLVYYFAVDWIRAGEAKPAQPAGSAAVIDPEESEEL